MVINIRGRQFQILIYLLKNKRTTYKSLAEIFEVSSKTIERDIDSLSYAGIPVHCLQGKGGGVFIDEKYKLSKSFFSNQDIHNIILALSVLDNLTGKSYKSEIIKKLTLITPELTELFERDAKEYFVVDLVDSEVDMPKDISESINHCLEEEVILELVTGDKAMKVAPISYVLKKDGMYLYCFGTGYELIAVNKIEKCSATDIEFTRDFLTYENVF